MKDKRILLVSVFPPILPNRSDCLIVTTVTPVTNTQMTIGHNGHLNACPASRPRRLGNVEPFVPGPREWCLPPQGCWRPRSFALFFPITGSKAYDFESLCPEDLRPLEELR